MRITWIRVATDLPHHPKSKLLERAIGELNAWAYVLKLWMWCSNYARDGRFDASLLEVVEQSCGWGEGDEHVYGALITALLKVGFLRREDSTIHVHDWEEHQGAAISQAEKEAERKKKFREEMREERARTGRGRSARTVPRTSKVPDLTGPDRTRQDETKEEKREKAPAAPMAARPPSPSEVLQAAWNSKAPPLPAWRELTDSRKKAAKARWEEHPEPGYWQEVVQRIAASDFCKGKNDRGWAATPDWLLKPDSAARVLEGKYDNRKGASLNRESTDADFIEKMKDYQVDEQGDLVL